MIEAECPNCGNFMVSVDRVDHTQLTYNCMNCNYNWSVIIKQTQFRCFVSKLTLGLVYPEIYDAKYLCLI